MISIQQPLKKSLRIVPCLLALTGCMRWENPAGPGEEGPTLPGSETPIMQFIFDVPLTKLAAIRNTSDGGSVCCFSSAQPGGTVLGLVRTSARDELVWSRAYTHPDFYALIGTDCRETLDGGFIVIGYGNTRDRTTGAYILKTDPQGNEEWSRTYVSSKIRYASSIVVSEDGLYYYSGAIIDQEASRSYAIVVKLDPGGGVINEWAYDADNLAYGKRLWQTDDGGFVMSVECDAIYTSIIWLGQNGELLKRRDLNTAVDMSFDVYDVRPDGGYIAGGAVPDPNSGDLHAKLQAMDGAGTLQWEFISDSSEWIQSACQLDPSGYGVILQNSVTSRSRVLRIEEDGSSRSVHTFDPEVSMLPVAAAANGALWVAGRYKKSWAHDRLYIARIAGP